MALLTWKADYSVGIREIDDQHKRLVAMINELHDAMGQGKAKEALNGVLADLASYTVSHFANEERLMKTHGYPGYEEHKAKHDKMTAKVLSLQKDCQTGKVNLSFEVANFLKDWLDKHIRATDKKYAPFLASKSVH